MSNSPSYQEEREMFETNLMKIGRSNESNEYIIHAQHKIAASIAGIHIPIRLNHKPGLWTKTETEEKRI